MEKFLLEMAEIFDVDVDTIKMDTRFRDIDGWGSMVGYSILILMEEDYNIKISVQDFLKINTFGEIFARIGK